MAAGVLLVTLLTALLTSVPAMAQPAGKKLPRDGFVGPLDVRLDVPPGAQLGHRWLRSEGLGRCTQDETQLSWALPRLSGGKSTAGPFVAVLDVSSLRRGSFIASVGVGPGVVVPQEVSLEKP